MSDSDKRDADARCLLQITYEDIKISKNRLWTSTYYTLSLYAGLIALPWLLWVLHPWRRTISWLLFAFAVLAGTVLLWRLNALMPIHASLLYDFGLGPILLRDVAILGLPHQPSIGLPFQIILTLFSLTGALLLVLLLWQQRKVIVGSPTRSWAAVHVSAKNLSAVRMS